MKKRRLGLTFAIIVLDIISILCCFFAALLLRFDFEFTDIARDFIIGYAEIIPVWAIFSVMVFACFKLYSSIWSFVGVSELIRTVAAYGVLFFAGLAWFFISPIPMPRSFYCIGFVLSFFATLGLRFAYRFYLSVKRRIFERSSDNPEIDNIMIIGAGEASRILIREISDSGFIKGRVVCVIDDNPVKWGHLIDGIRIVGGRNLIVDAADEYDIDKIIFAIPSADATTKKEIMDICSQTKCELQTVPGVYQLVNGDLNVTSLRKVDVQDLLGRDTVKVNMDEIYRYLSGKVILVTGGGGSIGSELCRQIAKTHPKQLIILDIYENNAYAIQMELKRECPELNLEVLIGSVRNTARLDYIFSKYQPNIVFHAAAHKHVPLMEDSPNEAVKNNVFGTLKLSKAAAQYGVEKFVLISTDKAVNPTNIMGATKRQCEMVVQMMNRKSDTDFVAVRFGNVLGSNGSVVPLFKEQIEHGGPVTVTHPDINRFFMTIPEAVSLVLQAGYYANGGEIFVLDMGQPVKIADMARKLIRLSGYEPDVDIKIEYTGLRPGEKLYEELLMDEEGLEETENKLIHIGKPIEMDDDLFEKQLEKLEKACKEESEDIKEIVAEIVTTYKAESIK